ncbi:MAG: type II toxin-antitoxin system HicA family toxin [Verrucomicrobiales bacterium]|nr:type II toxin-antitoxin system HicA family toxin [Verrucomicrobiales bacterium]
MPKLPGIGHQAAIRVLAAAGFLVVREGKHTLMSNGIRLVVIPRHDPINAFTMGRIVQDAGFTVEEFKRML